VADQLWLRTRIREEEDVVEVCCNGSVTVGTADDSPSGSELSVYCESTSSSPALTLVVTTVVCTHCYLTLTRLGLDVC